MAYPSCITEILRESAPESCGSFDVAGVQANLECGCFVRFGLSAVASDGRVTGAGFSSNGCGYMVAAAKLAVDAVAGRHLSELKGRASAAIEQHIHVVVGEFPAERRECLAAVVKAASDAFVKKREKQAVEFRGEAALICTCFGITEDAIRAAVSGQRLRTARQVGEVTNAGTGCGSCHMLIRELLDAEHAAG